MCLKHLISFLKRTFETMLLNFTCTVRYKVELHLIFQLFFKFYLLIVTV